MQVRWLLSMTIISVAGLCFLGAVTHSNAAADKDIAETVNKIADALEKKDTDNAKKLAQTLKDEDKYPIEDVMQLFKPRKDKGLGIGPKAGAVMPDGIELKVIAMAMNELPQKELDAYAADLARAAYIAAAVAEVAKDKCPVTKKEGDKDPKDWKNWVESMQKAALELADAAKTKKPSVVKAAADKVDGACKTCHKVFKEE
jgi:cytochrome c556